MTFSSNSVLRHDNGRATSHKTTQTTGREISGVADDCISVYANDDQDNMSTSCAKATGLSLEQIMQAAGLSTYLAHLLSFMTKYIETVSFGSVILNTTKDEQQWHK